MNKLLLACFSLLPGIALAQGFQLHSQIQGQALQWSDGTFAFAPESAPPRLGYAVMRLRQGTALKSWLPPNSQFALVSGVTGDSLVRMPIDSLAQLDALAPIAHAEGGSCGNLEFVANGYSLANSKIFPAPFYSSWAKFPALSQPLAEVNLTSIRDAITHIMAPASRYHSDPIGKTASVAFAAYWKSLAGPRWTISEVPHQHTDQSSVVARLPGENSNESPLTIVLGAHLDSIAHSGSRLSASAPGADDDASGLAVLTEVLRIIEKQQLSFQRSIELHAYAAEEVGLIGSRELAASYRSENKRIHGMMQVDMAFYSEPGSSGKIFLLDDYSSRDLRRSAIDWIRQFIGPYYSLGHLPNGSASDHKAWWEQGYGTLFPFENPEHFNSHIHTPEDTAAHFDDGLLIQRITQLGLLFLSYQAGLSQLSETYAQQAVLPTELPQDLFIATEKQSDGNSKLWISAPALTTTLEFCPISAPIDQHCGEERLTLETPQSWQGRQVFSSLHTFGLAPAQRWRMMAYDASDQLLAWRQVELSE